MREKDKELARRRRRRRKRLKLRAKLEARSFRPQTGDQTAKPEVEKRPVVKREPRKKAEAKAAKEAPAKAVPKAATTILRWSSVRSQPINLPRRPRVVAPTKPIVVLATAVDTVLKGDRIRNGRSARELHLPRFRLHPVDPGFPSCQTNHPS